MIQSSVSKKPSAPESVTSFIQTGALQHIAIIMDGNRRWAQSKLFSSPQGHYHGYQSLKTILAYCSTELNLPILTVYAFSTENWHRPSHEVNFLLKLFQQTLQKEIGEMADSNIRLKFLGNLDGFPAALQRECYQAEALTAENDGLLFQVAWNYGSRAEIVESCKRLAREVQAGRLLPEDITEAHIVENLYTGPAADPDLIIRTGGEYRLSNFLLWQSAYAEICVVDELWPDFTPEILNRVIEDFQQRKRRFGK